MHKGVTRGSDGGCQALRRVSGVDRPEAGRDHGRRVSGGFERAERRRA
jgi:hypothetical protein